MSIDKKRILNLQFSLDIRCFMSYALTENELRIIAKKIKDDLFFPVHQSKTTIFLCGADIKNKETARARMAGILDINPRFHLLYPEDIFDDLLAGQGQYSLLELENILADSVDCIVIFPESPGSFAEIGAFSINEKLAKKMIVLSNRKYRNDKSFINYGPYRLIKRSKSGKVININYDDLSHPINKINIYRNVNSHISQIKKNNPVEKNIANLLEAENFILPCIYLFEYIDTLILNKLMKFATNQIDSLCEIATKSTIGTLTQKHYISRTNKGLVVTKQGIEYVRNNFDDHSLDAIRIELLNSENRRNSRVSRDRINLAGTLSE